MTLKCQGLVNTASLITSNLGLSFKCYLVQVSQFNKQQQIIVTLTPSCEFKTVCMESSVWQFSFFLGYTPEGEEIQEDYVVPAEIANTSILGK